MRLVHVIVCEIGALQRISIVFRESKDKGLRNILNLIEILESFRENNIDRCVAFRGKYL